MGELSPFLIWPVATWPVAGGRVDLVVLRVGGAILDTTSSITQENPPCTMQEQHTRANPVSRGVRKPAPKLRARERWPQFSAVLYQHGHGQGNEASLPFNA